jgi:hypothetical protein
MAGRTGAQTVEVPGASYSIYISQPAAVADLIKQVARGLDNDIPRHDCCDEFAARSWS